MAYLKEKLGVNQVETENPTTFLAQLQERLNIDGMGCHYIQGLVRVQCLVTSGDQTYCCKPVSQLQNVFRTMFCCYNEAYC